MRGYAVGGNTSQKELTARQVIDNNPLSTGAVDAAPETKLQPPSINRNAVPRIGGERTPDAELADAPPPEFAIARVDAVVPPLALSDFIDLVFGEMLGVPYTTGPEIAARKDVIQLRSSGEMDAEVFYNLVSKALKEYGVRVYPEGGVYKVLEDSALAAQTPRFVRSRARASAPAALRPVVQFVELNAISAEDMAKILRQAFDARDETLRIEVDQAANYIVLSGLPEDVNAALSIVYEMDELRYAGTQVQRYAPVFWTSGALVRELSTILQAEGWQTSESIGAPRAILLVSVNYSNDVLVFTRTAQARARVAFWIKELDRPATRSDRGDLFVYDVRHMKAEDLAGTVNRVLLGIFDEEPAPRGDDDQPRQTGRGRRNGGGGQNQLGAFVVDPLGNRLIYSGSASDYERVLGLLENLDTPTPEVLIEVTVAQVTLSDTIRSGVEWVVQNVGGADLAGAISSFPVGDFPAGGLDFSVFPGNAELNVNAFAENTQVNVLATPRLVARSGAAARAQVGSEIPILSAQRTPIGPGGGQTNLDVISQVEYRSTGVILEIEPIVFSDNRIDLNISQEVSSTLADSGSGINSPSFQNTNIVTNLSLEDGATAVIGGLIQDTVNESERGIPFLKDIPVLGNAFSVRSTGVDRVELVVLITAFVLRTSDDKAYFAKSFSNELDARLGADNLVTLRPRKF
ncbi:MAG: secretin N-terminal domain-containing protein [Pseudomonadota bacterium]